MPSFTYIFSNHLDVLDRPDPSPVLKVLNLSALNIYFRLQYFVWNKRRWTKKINNETFSLSDNVSRVLPLQNVKFSFSITSSMKEMNENRSFPFQYTDSMWNMFSSIFFFFLKSCFRQYKGKSIFSWPYAYINNNFF